MKILKTIVDEQYKPIGFEVEGQSWEFGGIGNSKTTTQISIENMHQQKFKNSQIEMKANTIVEQGQFRLRNLPMLMLHSNNSLTAVDNKITLLRRILLDGRLAGFDVRMGGLEKRLTSESIIGNAGWYIPDNFVIRYGDKTRYIAGKPGMSIEKLPEISLTSKGVTNKKNATRTATDGTGHEYSVKMISPYDIISLTDILKTLNGKFIYLPGTNYRRISSESKELDKAFRKTGVEISEPVIDYSEKTVNVSIPFKQIGQLIVNVSGVDKTYYPFAFKKKTVFEANKLNSPYLGIAIPKENVEKLQSIFGASLSLSVITDMMTNMYVKTFMQLKNPDDFTLLALDTSNLSAMSIENARKYRLNEKDIKALYKKLINTKVSLSYIRGVMKDAEAAARETTGKAPKPLYGSYRTLSEAELEVLVESGIDVFTGAFTKEEVAYEKAEKTEKTDMPKKVDISVEYGIAGYKTLPTYANIKAGKVKEETYGAELERINQIKAELNKMTTSEQVYKLAKQIYDKLDGTKEAIVREIWLNNMASLTLGGGQGFTVQNKLKWMPTKTLTNGIGYGYTGADAEGLTLNLYGIAIS